MMRRLLFTIGSTCALIPLPVYAADLEPVAELYNTLLKITREEQNISSVEPAVREAIPQVLAGRTAFPITAEHVDAAVLNRFGTLCNTQSEDEVTYAQCMEVAAQIVELAQRESWVRSLGRDLMMITTSYEPEADGHTGRKHELSVKLPAAMYWWQSGSDRATNPASSTKVRLMEIDEDAFEEHANELSGILNSYSYDSRVALLTRYKHGYASIQGEENRGSCDDDDEGGGGGELGQLYTRSCEVEDALHAAWEDLPLDELEGVDEEEIVVFPVIDMTVDDMSDVVLWLRKDDVGILWGLPLQPVLPNMTVPSGSYAGSPGSEDSGGICSHAFGQRGYLCRPQEIEDCPIDLEPLEGDGEDEPVGGAIDLQTCAPHWFPTRKIESGANSCQVGGWRIPTDEQEMLEEDTPDEDEDMELGACENCKVDLICKSSCDENSNISSPSGVTELKNDDSIIPICLHENQISWPFKYLIMHELVHAQQACNKTIGAPGITASDQDPAAACCTVEYYPYVVACKAMLDDGLLDDTVFSAEECALMLSNLSCLAQGTYVCTGPPPNVQAFRDKLGTLTGALKLPAPNPELCKSAVRQLDPKNLSIKESLKLSCTPDCEAQYENTIGNNLCYISQCVEESLEAHRLVPGRIPYVTQDEAFPWDACMKDRSEMPDLVAIPPLSRTFLPPYRGRDLVEQMDMLLCQVSGLPKLSPPVLCTFHPNRRNNQPLRDYATTFSSLLQLNAESALRAEDLQGSAQNIGTRMATVMYQQYLHKALQEFADLVRAANGLIHSIGETALPSTACPRNYTGGCGIFQ